MKKQYALFLALLLSLFSLTASATTWKLNNGTAKLLSGNGSTLYTELQAGDTQYSNKFWSNLVIVAGEGLTIESVVFSNSTVSVSDQGVQYSAYFGGYYVYVNDPWNLTDDDVVTINLKASQDVSSYNVKFKITNGTKVELRHYDYSGGFPPTVDKKEVINNETVNLPAKDVFAVYPVNGEFESITKPNGDAISLVTGEYFQIDTYNEVPEYINVKYKAPDINGINFFVSGGNADIFKMEGGVKYILKECVPGDNIYSDAITTDIYISGAEGYEIVSVIAPDQTVLNPDADGKVLISTKPTEGIYTINVIPTTGLMFISVDDASKVQVVNQNYSAIDLVNGRNKVSVTDNTSLIIQSKTGGELYKVTRDNVVMTPNDLGNYNIDPTAEGMEVKIEANYPDIDVTYTLEYVNLQNVWVRVEVGDPYDATKRTPVTLNNNSFTVKLGQQVCLFVDDTKLDEYVFNSAVIQGKTYTTNDWFSFPGYPNLNFVARESGKIVTDIKSKTFVNVEINITGSPSDLNITYGDPSGYTFKQVTGLNEGSNNFRLQEGYGFKVTNKNNSTIKSVTYKTSPTASVSTATEQDGTYATDKFTGDGQLNIEVEAGVIETFPVTITVNSPDDVLLYTEYSYYDPTLNVRLNCTLQEGENTVNVPKGQYAFTQVFVVPASSESEIKSVSYRNAGATDWSNANNDGHGNFSIFLQEGSEVEIDATHVNYDSSCTIYTDQGNNVSITLENAAGRVYTCTAGYREFFFSSSDNIYTVKCNRAKVIYVNGEKVESSTLTLKQDDLVKIYVGSVEPITLSFDFKALKDENTDVKVVDIVTDFTTEVEAVDNKVEVLYGTAVSFAVEAPEDVKYTVALGDNNLSPVDGVYTVYVLEDSSVVISYTYDNGEDPDNPDNPDDPENPDDPNQGGISTISRDELDANATYYDLTGRRVTTDNIATGIYIRVIGTNVTKIAVK